MGTSGVPLFLRGARGDRVFIPLKFGKPERQICRLGGADAKPNSKTEIYLRKATKL